VQVRHDDRDGNDGIRVVPDRGRRDQGLFALLFVPNVSKVDDSNCTS